MRTVMGVVPECPGLMRRGELVQERVPWLDGALGDAYGSIGPGTTRLEESVPMLFEDVALVSELSLD